ncbi:MAG: hypothetical protein ACREKE_05170, partial [bacterium]
MIRSRPFSVFVNGPALLAAGLLLFAAPLRSNSALPDGPPTPPAVSGSAASPGLVLSPMLVARLDAGDKRVAGVAQGVKSLD